MNFNGDPMYRVVKSLDHIFAMSNMVGKYVKLDGPLKFSFYFGTKQAFGTQNKHGIRVKLCPSPERYQPDNTSELEIHGNYTLHNTANLKTDAVKQAREFFKNYKVLFAGVWEEVLLEENVTGYLKNRATLQDLIVESNLTSVQKQLLENVQTLEDFEVAVRKFSIFNMND